ncbi:MAG: hypothetical protein H0U86_18395 [Chloroflexi bacterium]|nr:hypothetical protein [Chloroflexota bacterium]
MRHPLRAAIGSVVVLGALVACIPGLGACDMKPLIVLPLAAVGPVGPRVTDPDAASCASIVEFDGRSYFASGGEGTWTVDMDDLDPIGLASSANDPAWTDATVFTISGVEPADAIAMRYGTRATISVLLTGDLPESVCAYLAAPEIEPACAGDG